jgi:hypothetical protein
MMARSKHAPHSGRIHWCKTTRSLPRPLNAAARQRFPARLPLRSPTFVDHRLSTARECGQRWRPNIYSASSARFGRCTTPCEGHNCRYRSHARFRATVAIFRRKSRLAYAQGRKLLGPPLARRHSLHSLRTLRPERAAEGRQRFPARLRWHSPTFAGHPSSTARECGQRWRPNTNSAWSARYWRCTALCQGHNRRYRSHARSCATVAIFRRELKPPHVQGRYPLARHHSLRTRNLGAMQRANGADVFTVCHVPPSLARFVASRHVS